DGLIIIPALDKKNLAIYQRLLREDFPFVFINICFRDLKVNYIRTNDYEAAYQAVSYLIKMGHKKIAHIRGPIGVLECDDRFLGYKDALAKNKIYFRSEYVKLSDYSIKSGYKAMNKLLKLKKIPSAIFCVGDDVAIGAYEVIREAKLTVPDDIALIGFGDIPQISTLEVPLTTFNEPKYELGEKAVEVLMENIAACEKWKPKEIVIKSKFIIRKSC
ncbi:unnamed protein product, partial [marine sediment metagenome]